MALLAAVGIVAFNQVSSNARIAAAKAELTTVAKAAVAELTMREASAFDAVWVTPLYGEVIAEVDAGETVAGGFTPLGPNTPLTAVGQYGLAFKDLAGQVNATQGVGVTFATWVDGTVVSVSASVAGTIADREADNTAAWASEALNGAVQERTNLATNPSFETANGTVVVRTNLHQNPAPATDATYWGSASNYGNPTTTYVNHETLGACVEATHGALNTTTSGRWHIYLGGSVTGSVGRFAVTAGVTYTASFDVADEVPQRRRGRFAWYGDNGVFISESGVGAAVDSVPTAWTRVSHTATAPEGATRATFFAETVGATPQAGLIAEGQRVWARHGLIEASPVLQPYFDGNTRPVLAPADDVQHVDGRVVSGPLTGSAIENGFVIDPDFTPAWTGELNKSTSVLRGVKLERVGDTGVVSSRWHLSGTQSIRLRGAGEDLYRSASLFGSSTVAGNTDNLLRPGRTYRVTGTAWLPEPQIGPFGVRARQLALLYNTSTGGSGQTVTRLTDVPNEAGTHPVEVVFEVPENAVWAQLIAYHGVPQGNGDVWWDDIVIEDITDGEPADNSYFDGDTPGTTRSQYRWNGAPHRATSVALAW